MLESCIEDLRLEFDRRRRREDIVLREIGNNEKILLDNVCSGYNGSGRGRKFYDFVRDSLLYLAGVSEGCIDKIEAKDCGGKEGVCKWGPVVLGYLEVEERSDSGNEGCFFLKVTEKGRRVLDDGGRLITYFDF